MSDMIMLAAGGTGGHVFPATALADKLAARGMASIFLTDRRGKRYLPDDATVRTIASASPSGSIIKKAQGMIALGIGVLQSLAVMISNRPKLVVGFGSYAMAPPILAAALLRIPIVLHEQNAVLGRAHRRAISFAKCLALSHNIIFDLPNVIARIAVVTGNPVRAPFEHAKPYDPPRPDGPLRMLIVGGSQGASLFGIPVAKAISALPSAYQGRLSIKHQVRADDQNAVREIYAGTAATADIAGFFDNPSPLISDAHLIISRAGATIVAELTALGRPAILVPFAGAIDQDQMSNAADMAGRGGAVLLSEDEVLEGQLIRVLNILLKDPGRLTHMAAKSLALGRPKAADYLADLVRAIALDEHSPDLPLPGNQPTRTTDTNGDERPVS